MSLLSWMFRRSSKYPESSGLSRVEPTRPAHRAGGRVDPHFDNAQPANRKGERMAQRELLYALVRSCMARCGVLSASYKFKVLSLDGHGRQFLIMVDLARDHGTDTSRLAEIEAMIAQDSKSRHDIFVSAVYWRMNDHVAVGRVVPPARPAKQPATVDSAPAPLAATASERSRYDPIQSDEVAAFRKALTAGIANPAGAAASAVGIAPNTARAFDGSSKHGPQSYTLLTGFEDTELPDAEMRNQLSRTQYGELN
jgi:hypothetical protein